MWKKIKSFFSYPPTLNELIKEERKWMLISSLVYFATSAFIAIVLAKVGLKKKPDLYFILAINALAYLSSGLWILFVRRDIQFATMETIKNLKMRFYKISALIPFSTFSILTVWIALAGDLKSSLLMILWFGLPVVVLFYFDWKNLNQFLAERTKEEI